jgi:hypothetical protein
MRNMEKTKQHHRNSTAANSADSYWVIEGYNIGDLTEVNLKHAFDWMEVSNKRKAFHGGFHEVWDPQDLTVGKDFYQISNPITGAAHYLQNPLGLAFPTAEGHTLFQTIQTLRAFHDVSRLDKIINQPPVETAIDAAAYIQGLHMDNWDEEGAKPITDIVFSSTKFFLRQYDAYLFLNFQLHLPIVEINPCANGSIDLSWRTDGARMLINIRLHNEHPMAFFYGDRYNNRSTIKGNTLVYEFSESLATWMKQLCV